MIIRLSSAQIIGKIDHLNVRRPACVTLIIGYSEHQKTPEVCSYCPTSEPHLSRTRSSAAHSDTNIFPQTPKMIPMPTSVELPEHVTSAIVKTGSGHNQLGIAACLDMPGLDGKVRRAEKTDTNPRMQAGRCSRKNSKKSKRMLNASPTTRFARPRHHKYLWALSSYIERCQFRSTVL